LFEVRAKFKEDSGDAEGAIQDYKTSLHYRNDAYNIYNQIALNYFRLKQFEKALLAFNIAIELKDNHEKQGLSDDLVPLFVDGAVQKVPKEVMLSNRANAKLNLGDFQGCLDDCDMAIEINPDYSNSYFVAGIMFLQVNQPNSALGALKEAERLGNVQAPPNTSSIL
jgi:tetratricopeptide (TPR) repeat protein